MPVPSDWSRDGQFIVYEEEYCKQSRPYGCCRSRATGSHSRSSRQSFPSLERHSLPTAGGWPIPRMSQGKREVYVRTFTGKPGAAASGGKWLISTSGGTLPRWRRDGKELFYLAPDGKLMAVEIRSGANFEAGAPKLLFDTHAQDVVRRHGRRPAVHRHHAGRAGSSSLAHHGCTQLAGGAEEIGLEPRKC